MIHVPVAVGLMLCDQVILEEGTHNVTPVNCFNVRILDEVPGQTSFFVLAWLADGEGETLAELIVQRLDNLDEIYRFERKLTFGKRPNDARFVARIRGCRFPQVGQYEVSLIMDREVVAHRKLRVQIKGGAK